MCLCVCVCVCNGSGKFGGGTTVVTCDHRTYTKSCALETKEQQLKRTQSGSSKLKRMHPAEADAVGEQH